ncbi:MAG: hypothetical protein ACPG5T_00045 [Endozoicomonas sp.]
MKNSIIELSKKIKKVTKIRNWKNGWADRLAYLILEGSEFAESVRGKGGDPVDEAGDVMFTAISLIESQGVSIEEAIKAAHKKADKLMVAPRYQGEDYE